jgi:hypothetical protein
MQGLAFLIPIVGVVAACIALGVSRASYYRALKPKPEPAPRPRPARALTDEERAHVLATLDSEAFMDMAPGQVYAKLLEDGEYLCSTSDERGHRGRARRQDQDEDAGGRRARCRGRERAHQLQHLRRRGRRAGCPFDEVEARRRDRWPREHCERPLGDAPSPKSVWRRYQWFDDIIDDTGSVCWRDPDRDDGSHDLDGRGIEFCTAVMARPRDEPLATCTGTSSGQAPSIIQKAIDEKVKWLAEYMKAGYDEQCSSS